MKGDLGKKRRVTLSLGLRAGFEVLALIALLEYSSIRVIKQSSIKTNVQTYSNLLDADVTGLTYRNSKFMQQLRMYTNSDLLTYNKDATTEEIAEWLIEHKKIRSKDFLCIYYVDGKTGMAYSDEGKTIDFSKTEAYIKTMEGNLSQYITNAIGKSAEDSVYYVCKSLKKDNKVTGFFVASVSHQTLIKAIEALKISEKGHAFLITSDGLAMAYKDEAVVMKHNFLNADKELGYSGLSEITKKMIAGEEDSGWMTSKDLGKELVVFKPVKGTPWALALAVPLSEINQGTRKLSIIQIIFGTIIAVVIVFSFTLSLIHVLKPLKELNRSISEIASGKADLTKRIEVKSNNEIGQVTASFNQFVEKLQTIMKQIKSSKIDLNNAGNLMHDGIDNNSASITNIFSTIEEVTSQIGVQTNNVSETATAVNEIASNIESLERMITTQAEGVSLASSAVEQMIGNISSVDASVAKMASSFEALESKANTGNLKQQEMSQKIQKIEEQSVALQDANKVIANIASQTNLLAMNAAIEAAHAGEAGKGFSVVAGEIRKLSETSTAQSKRIGEQLKVISDSIQSVVETSEVTQETFSSVNTNIQETTEIVRQIKSAMDEQNEGSKQIIEALHGMSDSTTEVRAASQEMSVGNKTILEQIKKLKDATDLMQDSVNEMSAGASAIQHTGNTLDEISSNMNEAINQIGSQIDSFQV